MSNKVSHNLLRLAGVEHRPGEDRGCALVFHLETESGQCVKLTHCQMMNFLRAAEDQSCIPSLPSDWWARVGGLHGCSV